MALATDGDRDTDKRHTAAWRRYEHFDVNASLHDIVGMLVASGGIERWPVSDLLHLLKNLRQRIRDNNIAWDAESPVFTGTQLNELFGGGVPAIATRGQAGSMNDGLALELFDLDFVLRCVEIGEVEAVRFFLSWALLTAAVRSEDVSRSARTEMVQVSFAMMWAQMHALPATGATKGIAQKRTKAPEGDDLPLTVATRQQLRRGMNLGIALYWALDTIEGPLALGRVGSHSCESHFGRIRAILRGHTQVRMWNRAEAAVCLMDRFMGDLQLEARSRPGRVSAPGVRIPEFDDFDEVQSHWAEDEQTLASLLECARAFATRQQLEFVGPIRDCLDALVEWLRVNAPHGLRMMSHRWVRRRCLAEGWSRKK
jgi:hypothetical protein